MDVRDNFMFIDTENCNRVISRLYGWCIVPSTVRGMEQLLERSDLYQETYDGSYVVVQNFPQEVVVCQDARGSHGLYLYQANGYFALADSFLLLLEKLGNSKHCLTLNRDYLDSFLLNGYTMESCVSTPILEVQELPRNVSVRIDKTKGKVSFYEKALNERSVDIGTLDAMRLIDAWHDKWTGIINKLIKDEVDINVDLSGGFDSRIIFMLLLGAGAEKDKINIHSAMSKVHTFEEDYEIASEIAEYYGLQLNACEKNWEKIPISEQDSLAWSFYIRMAFHKQLQFQLGKYKRPVYHFAGVGGETIKHDQAATKEKYINNYRSRQKEMRTGYDFLPGFMVTLNKSLQVIERWYSNHLPEEIGSLLYNEGGDRHHHGKEMAEAFGSNDLRIGPLLDTSLQKIRYAQEYPYLLYAVLLMRFAPNLLNFRFNNQHIIPEHTLKEARRINALFSRIKQASDTIEEYRFLINGLSLTNGDKEVSKHSLWDWCKRVYESGFVKGNMGKLYPARVYEHAKEYYGEHAHYPMEEMWAAIAVACSVHYSELSRSAGSKDICNMLTEESSTYTADLEDFMPRWPVPEHRLYPECRIILYGAGKMGQAFHKQIVMRGLGKIVLWVDKEPEGKGEEVKSILSLSQIPEYDMLLIAIENRKIQNEVVDTLRKRNMPGFDDNKIILG